MVEATIKAGAKAAYVMKEPILAAIGAGISIQEPIGHMIVDIGGGTTDAAVISLGALSLPLRWKCAGDKINQAIADYIKKNFNLFIGDRTAEDIKIKIGSAVLVDEEMVYKIKGGTSSLACPERRKLPPTKWSKPLIPNLKI